MAWPLTRGPFDLIPKGAHRWAVLGLLVGVLVFSIVGVLQPGEREDPTSAKVWGASTLGVGHCLVRVELGIPTGQDDQVLEGRVVDVTLRTSDGHTVTARGTTDEHATVYLPFDGQGRDVLAVQVRSGVQVLADGPVRVSPSQYLSGERLEGGWFASREERGERLRVGIREGLAVPGLVTTLVVEVTRRTGIAGPHRVNLDAEGLVFDNGTSLLTLTTDAHGTAVAEARVTDLSAELGARSESSSGESLSVRAAVPVRAGIMASFRGARVVFSSPVERALAYYAWVGESGWIAAGKVSLRPVAKGLWEGSIARPSPVPKAHVWMVGNEPSLQGANVVGWFLAEASDPVEPQPTRILPLQPWTDGRALVARRIAQNRARAGSRARELGAGLAALLIGTLGFVSLRSKQRLICHFRSEQIQGPSALVRSGLVVGLIYGILLAVGVAWLLVWGLERLDSSPAPAPAPVSPEARDSARVDTTALSPR